MSAQIAIEETKVRTVRIGSISKAVRVNPNAYRRKIDSKVIQCIVLNPFYNLATKNHILNRLSQNVTCLLCFVDCSVHTIPICTYWSLQALSVPHGR